MLVTLFGIVTDVSELQAKKAFVSMLVTLFGMVTDVKPQYSNALSPMLIIPLGMVTDVSEVH